MKCAMNKFLVSIFLLNYSGIVTAQTITTTTDKDSILIGQQFQYKIETKFPDNRYMLHWLEVPDSFSHFEVVNRKKPDTLLNDGILTVTQVITLTSFDSGLNTIPSFTISLDPNAGGTSRQLQTDTVLVNVTYSALDTTKTFHDIKTIIEVKEPFPILQWIEALIALLLVALVVYLLYRYYQKRKPSHDPFSGPLNPYDEATSAMAALKNEDLLNKGEIKEFHTKLTDIFKRFLTRTTRRNLMNQTSAELLILLQSRINSEYLSKSANALRMSDAVKFAKFRPGYSESEAVFSDIQKIIGQINESTKKEIVK